MVNFDWSIFQPRPETDAEMIQDEVKRQVTKCTCVKQYRIHKIGEGKYRVCLVSLIQVFSVSWNEWSLC